MPSRIIGFYNGTESDHRGRYPREIQVSKKMIAPLRSSPRRVTLISRNTLCRGLCVTIVRVTQCGPRVGAIRISAQDYAMLPFR
jgi:hypothetical protein